jgi:thiol-disulfide isomerase/thioredoxin
MLFPRLSDWFAKITTPVSTAGQKIQPEKTTGFWGGLLFGVALGLLWTPCAGPILATITVLVATHAITWNAVLLTLSYSIGAGVPLFLIAYGSRKIIGASRFLSKHSEGIRCFFGGIMILFAAVLFFHYDMVLEQKLISYLPQSLVENNPRLERELKKLRGETPTQGKAPELKGIVAWINSPPLSLEQLKGKVVLIDFWTYSCINCLRTLPYLEKWDEKYKDKGLVIIGVHTPEFEFEKDPANIKRAAHQLGIHYPIAVDSNYETWQAYHNHYWPAHYLIDQQGNIRMVHFGEGAYVEMENAIRSLLGLTPLMGLEPQQGIRPLTPETYLGLARSQRYNPQISLKPYATVNYAYSSPLANDEVGLHGTWKAEDEYIEAESEQSDISLNFQAKQVYLVLSGKSEYPMQVYLDGSLTKEVVVDGDRKYDLVNTNYGRHLLSIKVPKGVKAYVFTFGAD